VALTKVIGKKAGYMGAMAGYGLLNLAWLTASAGESPALMAGRAVLIGVCAGGMILCAYALLSDAVRYDFVNSGERREGAFAGFTTLFDKLSAAAALAAMGTFLSAMGYVSSTAGAAVAQGPDAILAVKLCVSVVPAIAMAAGVFTVAFYRLDPAKLVEAEQNA
jgi:GPH family glycoside/pentoside/hexuronide:cation symporter